ncbi:MAG TPA: hypothetical protein PLP27_05625 [Crocinitomicaceae bacterium]|nr:hypothetical protein [Crocinitomicaceae bacterium]
MKVKPILFSTPMVQAILEGRKTQTRRIIKPQPIKRFAQDGFSFYHIPNVGAIDETLKHNKKAKYVVGDSLWVRETWCNLEESNPPKVEYAYKADDYTHQPKWKPSIFMPKEACRLFLKVTNVRVEKLQDISEEDAKSEGAFDMNCGVNGKTLYKSGFQSLWESINGKESWKSNPYVWVYEFKLTKKPNNF